MVTLRHLLQTLILTGSCVWCFESTLQAATVIFRHGDRAPTEKLPKDPAVNETFWPYGYGEMTQLGKHQQYLLGKLLQKRYSGFLRDLLDYKEIYVQSSDFNRCLVSAYSTLAGLYSNITETSDISPPNMVWQPAPVHTMPTYIDKFLAMDMSCDEIDRIRRKQFASQTVSQINRDYRQLFDFLTWKTGLKIAENGGVRGRYLWLLQDILHAEAQHNITLPDYTQLKNFTCNNNRVVACKNRTVWEILSDLVEYRNFLRFNGDGIYKFLGGPLLNGIADDFQSFISGSRSYKFNLYSGHLTTVTAVLSTLGIYNRKVPPYIATVLLELHSVPGQNGEYEVRVLYKSDTDNDMFNLQNITGCSGPCSLRKFSQLVKKYQISNWSKECGNAVRKPSHSNETSDGYSALPVLSNLIMIILSIFIIG